MTTGGDSETQGSENASSAAAELPQALLNIFSALAGNDRIIFKSQQIDDPELQPAEKQQIAQDVFHRNRENFLIRFGSHLNERQLSDFQALGIGEPLKPEENLDEMCLLLQEFQRKLQTRQVCVKNRRYAAMRQLLEKGEYFSEHEMMQRAPDLYQELVGQYMTEQEKKQRDSYDVRNTSFSGILMHTLEQKQRAELLEQVDQSKEVIVEEEVIEEVPSACRQQWGGFEDDAPVACSTTSRRTAAPTIKISTPDYYNPVERELLRHEFIGLMKERFLGGEDQDFDYAAVDDNAALDDLRQIEQDEEDAYFENSSEEEEEKEKEAPAEARREESEDELEIYMRHLNQHHSLQN